MNSQFKILSQHLKQIQVRTLSGPVQNLPFISCVPRIIVLLYNLTFIAECCIGLTPHVIGPNSSKSSTFDSSDPKYYQKNPGDHEDLLFLFFGKFEVISGLQLATLP